VVGEKKKKRPNFHLSWVGGIFFPIQFIKLVDTVTKHKTLDGGALQEK
jgi:hypothetical protein